MRESCGIGHSFVHLSRWELSSLSRFWRLRFGWGRPSYDKIKNSSLELRDRRCLLHGGGEWVSDRGDSEAGGTVHARTQNVGNLEIWIGNPLVPVVSLTDVSGIAQEALAEGPRCVIKKWGGGFTWAFLFAHAICEEWMKNPPEIWKDRNTDCHILERRRFRLSVLHLFHKRFFFALLSLEHLHLVDCNQSFSLDHCFRYFILVAVFSSHESKLLCFWFKIPSWIR